MPCGTDDLGGETGCRREPLDTISIRQPETNHCSDLYRFNQRCLETEIRISVALEAIFARSSRSLLSYRALNRNKLAGYRALTRGKLVKSKLACYLMLEKTKLATVY